ncbi:uncharacterized protein LOC107647259 [Arachis ipaensis]|uniref:uncharacterized protein LOC107647259 n=1 Tax=Arachis ipaensis TaxID=130454 RepID=UPI0007AEF5D1|nr:uncharacterized protein LOC107647259 [Arachis ipaensis]
MRERELKQRTECEFCESGFRLIYSHHPDLRFTYPCNSFVIGSDEDFQVLFHCRQQFFEVRTPELLAKFVDVVSNSGSSNQNPQPSSTVACFSLMQVGASSFVPVIEPEAVLVASPSFAADLNCTRDGEIDDTGPFGDVAIAMTATPDVVLDSRQGGAPNGVEDVLQDDDHDDDVEPVTVVDDNDDDIARSTPAGDGGAASSGMHLRQRKGIWEIKRYNGPHTCLATSISSDHRRLDYYVISAFILPMIRVIAAVSIKVLLNATKAHLVLDRFTGGFGWLSRSVDGTQLYGKHNGTLLVAIAHDGNSNIIHVAFALVEGENAESWSFFLSHLRQHVTHQPSILVISDRNNRIKAALEAPDGCWLPPNTCWAFCI